MSIFISHVNSLSADARRVDRVDAEVVVDETEDLGLGVYLWLRLTCPKIRIRSRRLRTSWREPGRGE